MVNNSKEPLEFCPHTVGFRVSHISADSPLMAMSLTVSKSVTTRYPSKQKTKEERTLRFRD